MTDALGLMLCDPESKASLENTTVKLHESDENFVEISTTIRISSQFIIDHSHLNTLPTAAILIPIRINQLCNDFREIESEFKMKKKLVQKSTEQQGTTPVKKSVEQMREELVKKIKEQRPSSGIDPISDVESSSTAPPEVFHTNTPGTPMISSTSKSVEDVSGEPFIPPTPTTAETAAKAITSKKPEVPSKPTRVPVSGTVTAPPSSSPGTPRISSTSMSVKNVRGITITPLTPTTAAATAKSTTPTYPKSTFLRDIDMEESTEEETDFKMRIQEKAHLPPPHKKRKTTSDDIEAKRIFEYFSKKEKEEVIDETEDKSSFVEKFDPNLFVDRKPIHEASIFVSPAVVGRKLYVKYTMEHRRRIYHQYYTGKVVSLLTEDNRYEVQFEDNNLTEMIPINSIHYMFPATLKNIPDNKLPSGFDKKGEEVKKFGLDGAPHNKVYAKLGDITQQGMKIFLMCKDKKLRLCTVKKEGANNKYVVRYVGENIKYSCESKDLNDNVYFFLSPQNPKVPDYFLKEVPEYYLYYDEEGNKKN